MTTYDRATRVLEILKTLSSSVEQIAVDEQNLYEKVGGSSPATPEGVAISAGRTIQVALVKAVHELGFELAEHMKVCSSEN